MCMSMRALPNESGSRLQRYMSSAQGKALILLKFAQIVLGLGSIVGIIGSSGSAAEIILNGNFGALLNIFSLGCAVHVNLYVTVIVVTLWPLLFALVLVGAVVLCRLVAPDTTVSRDLSINVFTEIIVLMYPGISGTILSVFVYDSISHYEQDAAGNPDPLPYRILQQDSTIDFDDDLSKAMRVYAGIMVFVYPLGVVALLAAGISFQRTSKGSRTPEQGVRGMLVVAAQVVQHRYKPGRGWYACIELIRRLMLTSGFLLMLLTSFRLASNYLIASSQFFLCVLLYAKPYAREDDELFEIVSQTLLVVLALGVNSLTRVSIASETASVVVWICSIELVAFVGLALWGGYRGAFVSMTGTGHSSSFAEVAKGSSQNPETEKLPSWDLELSEDELDLELSESDYIPDVQGQACSVTSTTTPPVYPTDGAFTTSGLVSMATATEVVTLQYTPNTPPDGFDDQSGLLAWEDAATWTSGVVPGDGEDVVLPEDTRVLLGGCSVSADTVYGKITIPASSELIFADEDIFFNTTGMQVEGKLTLGSESCRLHSDIVITLHGDRPDSLPAPAWYKGIAAVGTGTLDIHGSIFHPTWTRLAATAAAGDTQIYLQHRVNWRAGQRLVLTGTEIKDSRDWHRNEVREIANVHVKGEFSRITLTEALAYTHYGGPEYQGEVGLLSRNIVIQGDETSEPTDTEDDICESSGYGTYPCEHKWLTGYGGHTIAMGPNATTRFEGGVELYRMGQTNVLARYPWHVHVIGEGGFRSYLKHSSMHHTFYRCATIHGTHNTLVQDNVAYDAIGHCFYSGEDGVEENNTVAFNLGSHVHFMEYPRTAYAQKMSAISSYENLTQPADTTASPFYITNAYNSYIGNAASGGYAGFAVVRLPKPIMVFRDAQTRSGRDVPHSLPFLAFEGNSCHSVGSSWWVFQSCIYVGGQLWHPSADSSALSYNPGRIVSGRDTKCTTADGSLVKCPLVMNNTKIFLSNIGINNWGARGSIDAFEAHDTMRAAAIIGSHYVHNMLTECRTSSGFVPEKPSSHYYEKLWHLGKHVGFEWYDTLQAHLIDGITFRNCGNAKKNYPVWRFLTHSDRYVPGLMQSSRRVKYENVDREALVMPSSQSLLSVSGALANWMDDDGTAFGGVEDGSSGPKLIGAARDGVEWWRLDDNCTQEGMWYNCDRLAPASGQRRGVGSFTAVVDPDVQAQFAANNICMNVGSTPCPRIGSAMHLGQAGDPAEVGLPIRGNAVVTGPTNGLGWLLLFDAGSPVSAKFSKPQIDEDDTVIIVMPYPAGTTFRVTYEAVSWCKPKYNTCEHVFTKATSLREMLDGVGDQYYFSASRGLFFVRFTPQKRDALDFSQAPGYGNLGLSYFEHDNMTRIPGTVSGGGIVIEASGCTLNATNENFCEKSEYDDTDICSEFGYPAGSTQIAYDTCGTNDIGSDADTDADANDIGAHADTNADADDIGSDADTNADADDIGSDADTDADANDVGAHPDTDADTNDIGSNADTDADANDIGANERGLRSMHSVDHGGQIHWTDE
ncbi:G8 domain-containing protein DDB_G0286897 [Hondaea fermentalgiana]|uniref:G8 domain-containing protein DDB_G0286897 n=1 Tax=Hondaea fermentalgiana TaxID=2315210 RepID=A0A2R5GWB9_9STRA|nr:G8 domain-containing protein DDB_G0286897 [Hondaea fermentalgiana]|eukprot:GBG34875.1 G8 domain-containing protein DDB_G0286897 [Hondaea fermentalgiana]